jgi:hypothetical protein
MTLSTKIFLRQNRYLKLKKIIEVQVLAAQTAPQKISFFKKINFDFPIHKVRLIKLENLSINY